MLKLLLLAAVMSSPATQYQWYEVTNQPGWQAYGHLNAAGYVVDIVEWRRAGGAQANEVEPDVPNFGVSLPAQAQGNPVRSNDPAFAASIEQAVAAAGQAAQEAGEAANCPNPGAKPRPKPRPELGAERAFELLRDAPEAVISGVVMVFALCLVVWALCTKGPDAP